MSWNTPLSNRSILQLSAGGQAITNAVDHNRDGQLWFLRTLYRRGIFKSGYFDAFLNLSREKTELKAFSNYAIRAGTKFFFQLGAGISLLAGPEYLYARYDGIDPAFGLRRRDQRISFRTEITKRDLTLWGFAPVISVSYEHNFSTLDLYDFSRIRVAFTVTRLF
jgi:hypothetical protein